MLVIQVDFFLKIPLGNGAQLFTKTNKGKKKGRESINYFSFSNLYIWPHNHSFSLQR